MDNDLCVEHEKRIATEEARNAEQTRLINSLIDKQDATMDEVLHIRTDLGNGLTVRVIKTVKIELARLTRNATIAIAVLTVAVVMLQIAFNEGWL